MFVTQGAEYILDHRKLIPATKIYNKFDKKNKEFGCILHIHRRNKHLWVFPLEGSQMTKEYTHYKAKVIRLTSSTTRMNLSNPSGSIIFVLHLSTGAVSIMIVEESGNASGVILPTALSNS